MIYNILKNLQWVLSVTYDTGDITAVWFHPLKYDSNILLHVHNSSLSSSLASFYITSLCISKNAGISLVALADPLHGPHSRERSSGNICGITCSRLSTNPILH
jgi:hypothetical protein